jgi:hypothetical protein
MLKRYTTLFESTQQSLQPGKEEEIELSCIVFRASRFAQRIAIYPIRKLTHDPVIPLSCVLVADNSISQRIILLHIQKKARDVPNRQRFPGY